MIKMEVKAHISFTDEGVTMKFYEGDNVICCVGDEGRHIGKIVGIGTWQETEDAEPYQVVCIDTSKSSRSYSSEFVKVEDITYICKNLLVNEELPINIEETDKRTFINMMVGLGYDEKLIEIYWDKLQKIMEMFNISIDKALACTIYSLANNCSIEVPLKELCGVDIGEMEKLIDNLENANKFTLGMTIKRLGECFKNLGRIFEEEIKEEIDEVK